MVQPLLLQALEAGVTLLPQHLGVVVGPLLGASQQQQQQLVWHRVTLRLTSMC